LVVAGAVVAGDVVDDDPAGAVVLDEPAAGVVVVAEEGAVVGVVVDAEPDDAPTATLEVWTVPEDL
jgi:hypothetical protein